jgi:hypothetical protein
LPYGSWLAIWIGSDDLRVAVLRLIACTTPILDVVAITLLALHDAVTAPGRAVLAVVLHTTSQLVLVVTLVDVAAGIAGTPVVVEVVLNVSSLALLAQPQG